MISKNQWLMYVLLGLLGSVSPPIVALEPVHGYEIVAIYPHPRQAFTQGLTFAGERLIEGTGLRGKSTLREVDFASGRVLRDTPLPREHFGEGVTASGAYIYQLTYRAGVCHVYDRDSLKWLRAIRYRGEGWGLTHDGRWLIMSDGSNRLRFRDPTDFAIQREIRVTSSLGAVKPLNELEYVKGEIWANVWKTEKIARIDPETGKLLGWIDLSGLLQPEDKRQRVDVLNGIAYQPDQQRIFVTGKWWPKLFEIRLKPSP